MRTTGVIFSLFLGSLFLGSGARAGDLQVLFSDAGGNPVEEAVVEITAPAVPVPPDWDYRGIMDQVDKEFVDNVITVVKGSHVLFPNSDDIQHHVYSFSENSTFELSLYSGDEAEPVLFDQAGVSVVGCNIHDWMLGYIYVGDSHLMAISDAAGAARINGLEAGDYTFRVWHERAGRRDQFSTHEVTVGAQGLTEYRITLELGRDRRIRRAPTGSGHAYH